MADPPAAYSFVDFAGAPSAADYKDGRGTAARFWNPTGIARRPDGTLVVADTNNHAIREISPDGHVTTLAGGASPQTLARDGRGVHARLQFPTGAAIDDKGNVYFYEPPTRRVRRVRPDGTVETHLAFYGFFTSISSDSRGRIYVL
ncbi:MAG: hypothetical protein JNK60_19885, partial [Acidobacteria bacterium]|nr:hypothetical protein [Acidobacteriota bacterium]